MSNIGFVYILHNPAMNGIYKVGFTMRSPHARAAELSTGSGVAMDFEVVYYVETYDPSETEREIHAELAEYRINPDREFFRCRLEQIIDVFLEKADWLAQHKGSDYLTELKMPGAMFGQATPLKFESSLYEPAYLQELVDSFEDRMNAELAARRSLQ
jgi:hypothetical protein